MTDTIKIRVSNEKGDPNLKMNLLFHIPTKRLGEIIEYLENVAKKKDKKNNN